MLTVEKDAAKTADPAVGMTLVPLYEIVIFVCIGNYPYRCYLRYSGASCRILACFSWHVRIKGPKR